MPPKLLLGILVVLATVLAGCGSGSESISSAKEAKDASTATVDSSKDPCEPARFSGEVEDPARTIQEGQATPIEIGETKATLNVLRATSPKSVSIVYGEKRKFEAPEGSMLVSAAYRLKNSGPGELKPSVDVNSRMLLRIAGDFYPYAAALPCSIPITASWAIAHGGSNPAIPVPVGESATTAVVFIAPKPQEKTRIALVIPGQVSVELRGAGS